MSGKLTKAQREMPWEFIVEEALCKYAKHLRDAEAARPGSTYGRLKPEAVEEAADRMKAELLLLREQPRGSEAFLAVTQLICTKSEWTTAEIVAIVQKSSPEIERKEIYNVIGYLTKKGQLQSLGYGKHATPAGRTALSGDKK